MNGIIYIDVNCCMLTSNSRSLSPTMTFDDNLHEDVKSVAVGKI